MRCFVALALLTVIGPQVVTLDAQAADPHLARAKRVLSTTPLVDGHNDLPWAIREATTAPHDVEAYDLRKKAAGHTDLARLKQGMVGGQFWSIYIPGEIRDSGFARVQLEQIDIARRVIAKYPEVLQPAFTAQDVWTAHAAGRVAHGLVRLAASTPVSRIVVMTASFPSNPSTGRLLLPGTVPLRSG